MMNEEPKDKEEVARREHSKGGMMDEWYGSRAQGIHKNGERKKELVKPSSERETGVTVVRYFIPKVRNWGYFWYAGCATGLWAVRTCCWRSAHCSCSSCIVARICNRCAMNSDIFGLEGRGRGASVKIQNEKPRELRREDVSRPENAHDRSLHASWLTAPWGVSAASLHKYVLVRNEPNQPGIYPYHRIRTHM
jgi:hypothetical protein